MENIKEGICQTLKSSKHFITLISVLKTLYFVYIFTPQKSVKKKCTFLCIFSWFYITKNWDPYPVLAVLTSSQNRRPSKPLAGTEKPTRRNPRELTKSGRTGAPAGGWLAFTVVIMVSRNFLCTALGKRSVNEIEFSLVEFQSFLIPVLGVKATKFGSCFRLLLIL